MRSDSVLSKGVMIITVPYLAASAFLLGVSGEQRPANFFLQSCASAATALFSNTTKQIMKVMEDSS